jgi:hypothetical protein
MRKGIIAEDGVSFIQLTAKTSNSWASSLRGVREFDTPLDLLVPLSITFGKWQNVVFTSR